MKKEPTTAKSIDSEENFWQAVAEKSLEGMWEEEDKNFELKKPFAKKMKTQKKMKGIQVDNFSKHYGI